MVPNHYIFLEKLPLNVNGKIDRTALSKKEISLKRGADTDNINKKYETVETILSNAWKEVLGIRGLSSNDDFFSLGGHSLLAVKLASLLKPHTEGKFTVGDIFDNRKFNEQVAFILTI